MRSNVQTAITADRIRVSRDLRLCIEPAKAKYSVNTKKIVRLSKATSKDKNCLTTYLEGSGLTGTCR